MSVFMFYTSCIQYVFILIIYDNFIYRHKTVCQSLNLTGRISRNVLLTKLYRLFLPFTFISLFCCAQDFSGHQPCVAPADDSVQNHQHEDTWRGSSGAAEP